MKTLSLLLLGLCSVSLAAPPVVSNIRASKRPGTKLVDVYYDLSNADGDFQLSSFFGVRQHVEARDFIDD